MRKKIITFSEGILNSFITISSLLYFITFIFPMQIEFHEDAIGTLLSYNFPFQLVYYLTNLLISWVKLTMIVYKKERSVVAGRNVKNVN